MRLDDFVTLLKKPRQSRGQVIARCPAHDDKSPSLSVKCEGGRLLIHCFAGCSVEEVLTALNLRFSDLYENKSNGYRIPSRQVRTRKMTVADLTDRLTFADTVPRPLPEVLRPAHPLVPALIPAGLRLWVLDIAERMQCPIEFPAVAALVAAGAVIGNAVVVKPKARDSWVVVPNIWGAIVGEPGVMKSPAVNGAMAFIKGIERREAKAFEAIKAEIIVEAEAREAEKKAIRSELERSFKLKRSTATKSTATETIVDREALKTRLRELEEANVRKPKRLITSDATIEKLGELLNSNPRGLLNLRDELSGFIDSLDKPGREGDRAFYLETWDGLGTHNVDRIGRGSQRISNLTLSIFGTIQPSIIAPLLKTNGAKSADDGFIQRFQAVVYPDIPEEYEYVDRDPVGVDEALEVFEGLYDLDLSAFDQLPPENGGYRFVRFDQDGQEFFQSWLVELEQTLRNGSIGSSALRGHLGKYRSLMPALALIFHLIEHVANHGPIENISLQNAQLAAAWCSFFQAHAERLYDMRSRVGVISAGEILKKLEAGEQGDQITARDIYRNKWRRLTEPEDVRAGLELLEFHDYLKEISLATGGKPKNVFVVNPYIRRNRI